MQQKNLTVWKSQIKNVISTLSWTLLVILIAIALFLVYVGLSTKINTANGSSKKSLFTLYTIVSPSMEPNISVYDTIINKRVGDVSKVEKGDVITFISTSAQSQGYTVTHRVNDIIKDENGKIVFQTKGDNNLTPDTAYVDEEHLIGRVIFRIPQLGRIQFLLASKNSWLLLIMIPSLFMLIKYIIKLVKLTKVEEKVGSTVSKYDHDKSYKVNFTKKR